MKFRGGVGFSRFVFEDAYCSRFGFRVNEQRKKKRSSMATPPLIYGRGSAPTLKSARFGSMDGASGLVT
ncbi:hypothetical protein NL676_008227 [Syzygium grande]|nr:hypothetical protein NL676_008227 [Syzygium grande]